MEVFIQNIVSSIGVTDIIDILIVAFLFYKILGFIRETRAEQVVRGIVLVLIATAISSWAHLYTLHWILNGLITVGLIAIVVIFQPELRRLLESIGRSKFSSVISSMDKEKAQATIKEFVRGIKDMANSKTGALLVFERETSLNDIVETGTVINADISDQMIGNIFYEGAPLHDGALIVRGDKLYAAGCVLPLTENKKLDKSLGTRHRAGIGISEVSDALVIIVSEETGIISSVRDGKITRNLNEVDLTKILSDMYLPSDAENKITHRFSRLIKGGGKHVAK